MGVGSAARAGMAVIAKADRNSGVFTEDSR
jgi:hypothetical protein